MTAISDQFSDIREQGERAHRRLESLGYIWVMGDDKGGRCVYNQLGDAHQRIVWQRWDAPQTLAAERFEDNQWRQKAVMSLAEFSAPVGAFVLTADAAAFTGNIGTVFRQVANKLGHPADNSAGYYFMASSPAVGNEQTLHAIVNWHQHRVRIIPTAPEDGILVFERKSYLQKGMWDHIHRTTAQKFLAPEYRHDVTLGSIPEPVLTRTEQRASRPPRFAGLRNLLNPGRQ